MGLLTVQNLEGNRTLFVDKESRSIYWEMAGDAMGEDVQQVPAELVEDRDFLRAVARGIFKVLPDGQDSEAQEKLAAQVAKFTSTRRANDAEVMAKLDRPQDRQIVTYTCIAPLAKGVCDQPVMMRKHEANEVPPLCSRHKALRTNFVANDEGTKGSNSEALNTTWTYAGV